MAADLKDLLKKVLLSEGKKRFFFAYGFGKRKDKKGEGELVVRGKRPKKAEIEAELADPGEVYEGNCWLGGGTENKQTVYFQAKGKKLSPVLITRMIKTAKDAVGRQYDFQIPSPEEELRAAQLTEEGEHPPHGVPTPPTAPPQPPAPPPPASGIEVMKRLNALSAGIKTALGGPNQARVQTLFVAVSGQIKAKDFVQSSKSLDELETLVKQEPAPTPQPKKPTGKFVIMQQARLAWNNTRDRVMAELVSIEQEILHLCETSNHDPNEEFEVDLDEVKARVKMLYGITDKLNNDLLDQLDATLNRYDDETKRAEGNLAAAQLVTDYKNRLNSDPLLVSLDNNGFKTSTVKSTIFGALDDLIGKLV